MKRLIFIILLNCPLYCISQVPDSINVNDVALQAKLLPLMNQIQDLQTQINDLNHRNDRFANTNNMAGLLYLGGIAVTALYFTINNRQNDDLLLVAGGAGIVGTTILFFSSNSLRRKSSNPIPGAVAGQVKNRNYWE